MVKERISPTEVRGPAGRLEALLHSVEGEDPARLAVVCHPHPLFGGNMHNKVVHRIDRALFAAGMAVMRFNYRGVGTSVGRYDEGYGEDEDTRAVISEMCARWPGRPLTLAGFSFGAGRAMSIGYDDPRVDRLIAVGTPEYALQDRSELITKPTLFLHAEEDELAPVEALRKFVARARGPLEVVIVPASDHFFKEHLAQVEAAVSSFLSSPAF
ncbi:MAG: alpha/beta family hydrolase [Myxococcota bacterium]